MLKNVYPGFLTSELSHLKHVRPDYPFFGHLYLIVGPVETIQY